MTHADAFLQDIIAHPDDDTPRLIFADWLEEQGDAASVTRAEFIRVQCALVASQLQEQLRAELIRREQQLLGDWAEEWARPIRRLVRFWNFHRGFIDQATMLARTFLKHAGRLFRLAPIQHLRLGLYRVPREWTLSVEPVSMASLADCQHLSRLQSLDLSENQLESSDVRALVVSEHLTNLLNLDLSHNRIGDSGVRALAASTLLGRLERLDLGVNDFSSGGLRALALSLNELERSTKGMSLRRLELSHDNLSAAGQRLIAESPLLRRLVRG
jgi:uncharacterized protein (TIGR02996 family)